MIGYLIGYFLVGLGIGFGLGVLFAIWYSRKRKPAEKEDTPWLHDYDDLHRYDYAEPKPVPQPSKGNLPFGIIETELLKDNEKPFKIEGYGVQEHLNEGCPCWACEQERMHVPKAG